MKRTFYIIILLLSCQTALWAQRSETHNSAVSRNLEIFNEVYKMLDLFYVDTLSVDTVMQWAIDGMLHQVDPFTEYYVEDDDELRQMATGKYGGIGSIVRFHKKYDRVCISEPYPGTPSYEAGLKPGDIIISIDGKDIKGMPVEKVSKMLRGEAGTTFSLEIQKPGDKKTITKVITRSTIQTPAVTYHGVMDGHVGYILLNSFTAGAAAEVRQAFLDLKSRGIKSLVFDLRDNPGGALNEAVDIVNLFVNKGVKVVYTKGKLTPTNRDYYTTTEPLDTVMPIVVMVNGGTASSAEIVSGSLQDLDRAVVMGTRTYGKGLVQMVRDLPYRGELKVTTSRYYIPSGRCIQAYDYNHDGTMKVVPDSLQKVFHTRDGREVRDGGGIKPDTLCEAKQYSTMVYDLVQSDAFFEYGIDYLQSHPTIAAASEFHLTDAEYDSFVEYIGTHDFKYNPRCNDIFKLLREWAEFEGCLADVETEMNALQERMKGNLHDVLYRNKDIIKVFLETAIVGNYYSRQGTAEYLMVTDPSIAKALELINNSKDYNNILHPNK